MLKEFFNAFSKIVALKEKSMPVLEKEEWLKKITLDPMLRVELENKKEVQDRTGWIIREMGDEYQLERPYPLFKRPITVREGQVFGLPGIDYFFRILDGYIIEYRIQKQGGKDENCRRLF